MCIFAYLSRNSIVVSALGCSRLVRSMHDDPLNVDSEDDVFTRRTRASLYSRTREPCVVDSPDAALLEDFVVFSSVSVVFTWSQRMEKPSSPITATIFHEFPAISSPRTPDPARTSISKSIRMHLWKPQREIRRNRGFQTRLSWNVVERPLPWDETSNTRLQITRSIY